MADEPDEADADWTVDLASVLRVASDDPEEVGNLFTVEFEVSGADATGTIEIMVSDIGDESRVVAEALDPLQKGLEAWGRVVSRWRRTGTADDAC